MCAGDGRAVDPARGRLGAGGAQAARGVPRVDGGGGGLLLGPQPAHAHRRHQDAQPGVPARLQSARRARRGQAAHRRRAVQLAA